MLRREDRVVEETKKGLLPNVHVLLLPQLQDGVSDGLGRYLFHFAVEFDSDVFEPTEYF